MPAWLATGPCSYSHRGHDRDLLFQSHLLVGSAAGACISSGPKTGAAQSIETGECAAGAGTGKSPKTGATQSMETAGGAADTRCAGMWQRHTALGKGAAGTGGTLTKPKAGLNKHVVEATP